jgi:AAA15 family ATPase/GTPase
MEAQKKIKRRTGLNTFHFKDVEKWELLKSAFIYGKNAAGKSNFIKAVRKMREIVISPIQQDIKDSPFSENKDVLQVTEFQLNEAGAREPVEFEIEFIALYKESFCKFLYGFSIFEKEIKSEWLHITKKSTRKIFEREGNEIVYLNSSYKGEFEEFKRFLTLKNLFLSTVNALNDKENSLCEVVINYIQKIIIIDSNTSYKMAEIHLAKNDKMGKKIEKFILDFDQDIEAFKVTLEKVSDGMFSIDSNSLHKQYINDSDYELIPKKIDEFESDGTKKIMGLARPIVYALENGLTLFIDELDSNLHPLLVEKIIGKFNSVKDNLKNAQIICNTHNSLILDNDSLRKDQFWFVDKNEYGESELYRLTAFDGNVENNTMKKYLFGNFDAIPRFNDSF